MVRCKKCKKHRRYIKCPCEVSYRSNEEIKCDVVLPICKRCFNPNNVYVCPKHYSTLLRNKKLCEYAGQSYNDSPVYFSFPRLGIRRVNDSVCEKCNETFQVCHLHDRSPHKYTTCARCLGDVDYWVYGMKRRDLRPDIVDDDPLDLDETE